jgi:hypothetical protein
MLQRKIAGRSGPGSCVVDATHLEHFIHNGRSRARRRDLAIPFHNIEGRAGERGCKLLPDIKDLPAIPAGCSGTLVIPAEIDPLA